jgi:hypothetical protein
MKKSPTVDVADLLKTLRSAMTPKLWLTLGKATGLTTDQLDEFLSRGGASPQTITLQLPRSPAMITALDNMAMLAKDDDIPHLENELEEAANDPERAEKARAMIAAYDDFWEEVTRKLHPETLEAAQASIDETTRLLRGKR